MRKTKKTLLIAMLCILLSTSLLSSCSSPAVDNNNESEQNAENTTIAPDTSLPEESKPEKEDEKPVEEMTNEELLARIAKKIKRSDNYTIFTIGDSVTYGDKTSSDEATYTAQFAKMLGEKLPDKTIIRYDGKGPTPSTAPLSYTNPVTVQTGTTDKKVTVVRGGVCGDTIKLITERSSDFIGKQIDGNTGDLFIISAGINDAGINGDKYASPTKYRDQIEALVKQIRAAHPDADVVFMTPTYFGSTGTALDLYAKKMSELGEKLHIAVIDLHKLWMDHWIEGADNYGQGDWLTTDDCHPSDVGHKAMAEEMMRCFFETK